MPQKHPLPFDPNNQLNSASYCESCGQLLQTENPLVPLPHDPPPTSYPHDTVERIITTFASWAISDPITLQCFAARVLHIPHSTRELATLLHVSKSTISTHQSHIKLFLNTIKPPDTTNTHTKPAPT